MGNSGSDKLPKGGFVGVDSTLQKFKWTLGQETCMLIRLVIAWSCVGVFIATAIVTLLALVRVIELADKKYLDRLFMVLIVEVVGIAVGVFAGFVQLPTTVEKKVEAAGARRLAAHIRPDVETITANAGRDLGDPAAVAAARVERILKDVLRERVDQGN